MVCRDFILPEGCKPCLLLSTFQFAKLIVPYRKASASFVINSTQSTAKSEERISVPRFSYLLPQKCSQHINELAVGRRLEKRPSRNVLHETPDKRSQIPFNKGRGNAEFSYHPPVQPLGDEPDTLQVLFDLLHHIRYVTNVSLL